MSSYYYFSCQGGKYTFISFLESRLWFLPLLFFLDSPTFSNNPFNSDIARTYNWEQEGKVHYNNWVFSYPVKPSHCLWLSKLYMLIIKHSYNLVNYEEENEKNASKFHYLKWPLLTFTSYYFFLVLFKLF